MISFICKIHSYFAYFDDVPEEADISSIIGTIAVVAALMMTMVGATFAIVPYDVSVVTF